MTDRTARAMKEYDDLVRVPATQQRIAALLEYNPLMQQKVLADYPDERLGFLCAVLRAEQAPRAALLRLAESER